MIKVMTDTTCSLSREDYQATGIIPIPLIIESNDLSGRDLFEIGTEEFYAKQREGVKFSTSHLDQRGFADYFLPVVRAGHEVLCILLSSKISPCVEMAVQAAQSLAPDKITIVDSRQSGYGQAVMALKAKEMAEAGRTREEIAAALDDLRNRTHTFFIVGSLHHLKSGGRFFWDQAVIATLLRIKPIIWFDRTGKMKLHNKISSVKEVKARILHLIADYAKRGIERLALHYADNLEEAEEFAAALRSATGAEAQLVKLSAVVGAHTGPDLVGPCIVTKS